MTPAELHQILLDRFGESVILAFQSETKDPWVEVAPASIRDVCLFLRDDSRTEFDTINDLCGADCLETDAKKKDPVAPHVEVVYHLYSYSKKHWGKLKVKLPRWQDDQAGKIPSVPSVADVWAVADWHEREAYDLVGIEFTGHPNLKRILCPEDWVGHPLRKDYEFPLEYHGVRGR